MSPLRSEIHRAIETLRELIDLAMTDIETRLGGAGALGLDAQKALRAWLARAFEAGRDSRPTPESARRVAAYLEQQDRLQRATSAQRRKTLEDDLARMWDQLDASERRLVHEHS